jgi:hypothetical protein
LADGTGHLSGSAPDSRILKLPERGHVAGTGLVESITILPAEQAPRFSAVITDAGQERPGKSRDGGHPRLRLVWLGQRRVPGIAAGIRLAFEGMLFRVDGMATIYNPRYEILSPLEN